ncbi:Uncharacterised protein [Mycobacterium tuberculosis]|nr:Uncharacterised protein [Mycobacterium tuberculosis]
MLHCNPEFLHVVRPKTPRGDGNHRGSPALDHAPLVVSSDPKPREGTETFCLMLGRQLLTKSSDPKPREGTETRKRRASSDRLLVVRPKTPRGDGNLRRASTRGCRLRWSSDPKPREGTETRQQSRRPARMTPVVRPKTPRGDGNRMDPGELQMVREVVRPKTPRGDGNSTSISLTSPGEKITSSDPKPRERTETRRRSRRCRCPNRRVVRPKTPRGDGNLERVTADGTIETSRQTQNPERGRKLGEPISDHRTLSVVRPKTPRGDGNFITPDQIGIGVFKSSDPKPREGTETF